MLFEKVGAKPNKGVFRTEIYPVESCQAILALAYKTLQKTHFAKIGSSSRSGVCSKPRCLTVVAGVPTTHGRYTWRFPLAVSQSKRFIFPIDLAPRRLEITRQLDRSNERWAEWNDRSCHPRSSGLFLRVLWYGEDEIWHPSGRY